MEELRLTLGTAHVACADMSAVACAVVSQDDDDKMLAVLQRLDTICEDISKIRSTMQNMELAAASTAAQLDHIGRRLPTYESSRHDDASLDHDTPKGRLGSPRMQGLLLACAINCWLLSSQRGRRLLLCLPRLFLVVGILGSTCSVGALSLLEWWQRLLVSVGARSERCDSNWQQRRMLAFVSLCACAALMPAKLCAHKIDRHSQRCHR